MVSPWAQGLDVTGFPGRAVSGLKWAATEWEAVACLVVMVTMGPAPVLAL